MYGHTYDEQYYRDAVASFFVTGTLDYQSTRPLAVLSRDDAVARLYGRPAIDLQRAAKRRRMIAAVLEVRRQNTEGRSA